MVIFGFMERRLLRRNWRRVMCGFSLLEVVLVLAIMGVLASTLVPSVREIIERSRRDAELKTLEEIANTITASFESTDLNGINVAAFAGTIGSGDTPTGFSTATSGGYVNTASSDWFAKVARLRGATPQVGVSPAAQPEVARVAFNPLGNARWLFAAPIEAGRQRFLLVSLMARSEQLDVPAYAATAAWFDAIWNNDWESRSGGIPALWAGQLSAAQVNAWTQGGNGTSWTNRLVVRRIVLPKFTVSVNNNHPTDSAYVGFNNQSPAFTAPAGSGANTTPEIFAGRLIIISRGTSLPGVEALRFRLRENASITVQ